MTNEPKRHMHELADSGDRLSRRATVYALLLHKWARSEYGAFIGHSSDLDDPLFVCELCFAIARDLDHLKHAEGCLLTLTRRALAADDADLAAIKAALTGEG